MPLTPADVRNKQFSTTRLRPGYDEEEVDAFLDEVEVELDRREAEEMLGKARRQAEQITSDARARAESLERDAQERHRQAMGSLVQQREELERRVDDLRAFEREYRSRLKAYLEGQLRDLEAGATDSGTFPTVSGPQSSVGAGLRMDSRNGGQPAVTGAYVGSPEPAGHTGYHPSDSSAHDRR